MKAAELRASILQEAVSGKLVPQIASEGTAEDLLKQIEAERASLINEGKLKKEKPLLEITEEDLPFEIPENWRVIRLGDVCQLINGENKIGTPLPYLEAKVYRGEKKAIISNNGIYVQKGDTTILVDGENSGEVFIAPYDGYLGSTFKILRILHSLYFPYVYKFITLQKDKLKAKKTGYAIPHLNKYLFKNLVFPLPPLDEQKRIVAKLEELLPLIDQYAEEEEKLSALSAQFPDAMRKSILLEAVSGKLVPQIASEGTAEELLKQIEAERASLSKVGMIKKGKPLSVITDEEVPFEIPMNWKWVRLNEIYNFIDYRGSTPNKIKAGIPLITAKNVRYGYLDYTQQDYISSDEFDHRKSRGISRKGDIIFSTEAPMGFAAIADLDVYSTGQRLITFQQFSSTNEYLSNKYYLYVLLSSLVQDQLQEKKSGVTAKGIKADKLKQFLVPLPPLSEQKRIVAKIEELMRIIDKLKA